MSPGTLRENLAAAVQRAFSYPGEVVFIGVNAHGVERFYTIPTQPSP